MTSRPTSIGSTIGSNSITFWAIQSTPNAYANLDGRNPSHARSVRTAHSVRTARSFSRSRGAAGLTALPSIHSVAFQHPPMPEIPNQFQKHQSTGKASEYEPGKETSGSARTGSSDLAELLDERPHFPAWRWVLSLIGLYLGAMLYGLDTTIAADVQTAVFEAFGDIENIAWVGLGFPMASVAGILLLGRLYALFDVKFLLNASIIVFEAGSALCGAAPNMTVLIFGRVIAGLGGAGMYMGALTFLSALGSPEKLVLYNALIGASWGTGAILGPVIGGAFSDSSATWRWAFYINLPLAALFAPVYLFVTPSWTPPHPGLSIKDKLATMDWVGVALNASAVVLFIATITFSGSSLAWDSKTVITLWALAGLVMIAFCVQQTFCMFTTKERRIFPIHFLKSRDMVLLFIATACSATANAVTLYYIPLRFAFSNGDTAFKAAVRLLPFIVVFISFVLFAGATLPTYGRYTPYYLAGGILILLGSSWMFTTGLDTPVANVYGYEILIAAGAGICFQNAYGIAATKVNIGDIPNAIGFINTAQIGTMALSLAIASCLYQNLGVNVLRFVLAEQGHQFPDGFLHSALGGTGSAMLGQLPPQVMQTILETISWTIAKVFGMIMAAGALLLCVAMLMKHEKINMSGTVAGG